MIVGLGVLGTGLAYLTYHHIVAQLGPVRASGTTRLAPVVAVIIGVSVGESMLSVEIMALVTIIGGVVLIKTGKRNPKERRGSVPEEWSDR